MPKIEYGDFVRFCFYNLRSDWHIRSSDGSRQADVEDFCALIEEIADTGRLFTYSTVGTRAETDFLTVHTAASIEEFHELQSRINQTKLGRYLCQRYSYLSVRRKTQYKHGGGREIEKPGRYFILYPMVKKREWYALPLDERQQIMNGHFRVGHKYPNIRINTTYSFGLDDPEFVVGFEMDTPSEFVSLVMELRETASSMYTESETPIFTTLRMSIRDALKAMGAC